MALTKWDSVCYWEHEVGKFEMDIEYRKKELKQKLVNKEINKEEKDELQLLTV